MNEKVRVYIEFEHISEKERTFTELERHIKDWAHKEKGYFERCSNSYRVIKIEVEAHE